MFFMHWCRYLDRMFKLRLPGPLKAQVTNAFLNVKNTDDLKHTEQFVF